MVLAEDAKRTRRRNLIVIAEVAGWLRLIELGIVAVLSLVVILIEHRRRPRVGPKRELGEREETFHFPLYGDTPDGGAGGTDACEISGRRPPRSIAPCHFSSQ